MKKNIRTTTEFLSSLIKNAKHFSEEKKNQNRGQVEFISKKLKS